MLSSKVLPIAITCRIQRNVKDTIHVKELKSSILNKYRDYSYDRFVYSIYRVGSIRLPRAYQNLETPGGGESERERLH